MSGQPLYLVANSQSGLYLTAVLVFVSRALGYSIYLHHHVYWYIDRYDFRMGWIDRWMSKAGTHVVHCDKMAADFRRRYGSKSKFLCVYPSIVSIPIGRAHCALGSPLRIGLLSNLTIAKGVDLAIETFRSLVSKGQAVELRLAGPAKDRETRRLIDRAVADYSETIQFLGPQYGTEKTEFFNNLDVFLFPTRYENESWGIVINEALAAGVPVITCNRGCTATVVGDRAGLVVDSADAFVEQATHQIQRWIDTPDEYLLASQAAIEQAHQLERLGQQTLDHFAEHLFSGVAVPSPRHHDVENSTVVSGGAKSAETAEWH